MSLSKKDSKSEPKNLAHHELLTKSLKTFYSNERNLTRISSIIQGKHKLSLRLIDWFVTNYAKEHNTVIPRATSATSSKKEYFNVYLDYRAQLKAFTKQLFDPFRRGIKIKFMTIPSTTVGQLAFFRWAIQNGILTYLENENNLLKVETEMLAAHGSSTKSGPRASKSAGTSGAASSKSTSNVFSSTDSKKPGTSRLVQKKTSNSATATVSGSVIKNNSRRVSKSRSMTAMTKFNGVTTLTF